MELLKGALGGIVGGLIGASAWALVAYYAHVEIGWIAWGVGALTGFGVCVGMKGSGGAVGGVLAVVIALASIAGGKYATVQMHFHRADTAAAAIEMSDDDVLCSLMADAAEKAQHDGRKIDYKNGKNEKTATKPEDYPEWLAKPQREYYQQLTADQQSELRKEKASGVRELITNLSSDLKSRAFTESFGVMDIAFGILAILTAWRIGSSEQS